MYSLLNIPRLGRSSLPRAILLALASLVSAALLAGFPAKDFPRHCDWQFLSVLLSSWCMVEAFRCLGRKWSLFQAGVLILQYTGLMLLILTLFLWLYP